MAVLIEDTRQQKGKHDLKAEGFESMGVRLLRCKLPYGDYAKPPSVSVDTKKDIAELYSDLTAQHERFREEAVLATECGAVLVVLVENRDGVFSLSELAEWVEPDWQMKKRRGAKARIIGKTVARQCRTMEERYRVRFAFCHPSESARWVHEMLENTGEVVIRDGRLGYRSG